MKARKVKGLDPRAPLRDNARRIVATRLDELRSFVPAALDPAEVEALHAMRIAAKRLRYALELTGACFGAPAQRGRRAARDLQDLLGEIHDCDVMAPRALAHLAGLREADAAALRERTGDAGDLDPALLARGPSRTAYRGLDSLATYLQARRGLLFERFGAAWPRLEPVWADLERAIAQPAPAPRTRKRKAAAAAG